MKNLYADAYMESILELDSDFLKSRSLYGLILDVDNTLVGHNEPIPDKEIKDKLRTLSESGIKLCVVSNNGYERVKSFCENIGVKYFVPNALKPRLFGYHMALKEMRLSAKNTAAIGDQVFTDVWGAKRAGCFSILTTPLHRGHEGFFIALKRLFEKPFRQKKQRL